MLSKDIERYYCLSLKLLGGVWSYGVTRMEFSPILALYLWISNCNFIWHVSLQVNKPYLPLASGEYSVGTGVMIVTSFSILVLIIWISPLSCLRCNNILEFILNLVRYSFDFVCFACRRWNWTWLVNIYLVKLIASASFE